MIGGEVREGNGDEGDEVVVENKYKGNIKYEYLEKSPVGGNIGRGGYVGSSGEEIICCL